MNLVQGRVGSPVLVRAVGVEVMMLAIKVSGGGMTDCAMSRPNTAAFIYLSHPFKFNSYC
jgi:hypothetical protein